MKKCLKFIFVNLIGLHSVTFLVGCSLESLAEVWVISDGGDLFDEAFNYQIIQGAKSFTNDFNDKRAEISKISGFEKWKNHPMNYKWIISQDAQVSTLQNNYQIAYSLGARMIVCAGFNHIPALTEKLQKKYHDLGVKFILVDSTMQNPLIVAGLKFASEQSSFFAGIAVAVNLIANHEDYDPKKPFKVSTFGGIPADVIIESMAGFLYGIYYFNEFRASDPVLLEMINAIRTGKQKTVMTKEELTNDHYHIIFDKFDNSFTGGFQSGTSNAQTLTSELVKRGNNVIFPVAGGQTVDLISAIKKSGLNVKILGVDVDQSKQYVHDSNYFITSALKGILFAVSWMLWNGYNLKNDDGKITYDQTTDKYFNGELDYLPLKGSNNTGIANSAAVKPIFALLMTEQYWKLAEIAVTAFNKLTIDVENKTDVDKWANAWKHDVDSKDYLPDFPKLKK